MQSFGREYHNNTNKCYEVTERPQVDLIVADIIGIRYIYNG